MINKSIVIGLLISGITLTTGCNNSENQQIKSLEKTTSNLEQQLEEKETNTKTNKETKPNTTEKEEKNKATSKNETNTQINKETKSNITEKKEKDEAISKVDENVVKICAMCNEEKSIDEGTYGDPGGWACNKCSEKFNNGEIQYCQDCNKFYSNEKMMLKSDYDRCIKCAGQTCDACGGNNDIELYQLTFKQDGINMKAYFCKQCRDDNNELRKTNLYCENCGNELNNNEACKNCLDN